MEKKIFIYIESTVTNGFQYIQIKKSKVDDFIKTLERRCKTLKCTIIK